MKLKNFNVGDKVYLLCMSLEPTISEQIVKTVNVVDQYITIDLWSKYMFEPSADYLTELFYGEERLLFKTREAAEDYIEQQQNLVLWLERNFIQKIKKLSPKKLRKIIEIISS